MTFPVSAATAIASAPLTVEWTIPIPPTLLERWLVRARLTWPRAIVAAGAILLVSLAGAVWADGMTLAEFIESGAWRMLFMPSIAMYCLIVYPNGLRVNLFDPSFIQLAARLSLLPALAFAGGITTGTAPASSSRMAGRLADGAQSAAVDPRADHQCAGPPGDGESVLTPAAPLHRT